jgi:hypothetical protein
MKKTIIGLLAATALFGGLASVAEAKVVIQLGGIPYYDYQMGPDYRYYQGRGWYRHQSGNQFLYGNRGRISCGEAKRIVRDKGFRNVVTRECEGRTYTFTARRNGNRILLFVNSKNGNVWRG